MVYTLVRDSYSAVDGRILLYGTDLPNSKINGLKREFLALRAYQDLKDPLGLSEYRFVEMQVMADCKSDTMTVMLRDRDGKDPCTVYMTSVDAPDWDLTPSENQKNKQ